MASTPWSKYGEKDPKYQQAYETFLQWPRPAGPADLRAQYAAVKAGKPRETPAHMVEEDILVPVRDGYETRVRVYKRKGAAHPGPLAVIFHGGGFITGDRFDEDWTCRIIVEKIGAVALSVEYRLAPEHPFPAAINDCWDVVKWACTNPPALAPATTHLGLLVGGNSAGGNLATTIAHLSARTAPSPPVTGLLLQAPLISGPAGVPAPLSPPAPAGCSSYAEGEDAPVMNSAGVRMFLERYAAPLSSPLFNPFAPGGAAPGAFPPTFLQVAGMDPLRDEALALERWLREGGVATRVRVYGGLPHAFWFAAGGAGAPFGEALERAAEEAARDYGEGVEWVFGAGGRKREDGV